MRAFTFYASGFFRCNRNMDRCPLHVWSFWLCTLCSSLSDDQGVNNSCVFVVWHLFRLGVSALHVQESVSRQDIGPLIQLNHSFHFLAGPLRGEDLLEESEYQDKGTSDAKFKLMVYFRDTTHLSLDYLYL